MKQIILLLSLLLSSLALHAQVEKDADLYKTILVNDSLLFDVGFNTCDITQFEKRINDNFEFYHDQHGITPSKSSFISSIKDGLCKMNYKAKRVLEKDKMEVFPLKKNGILYGAIQTGTHHFYALEKGMEEYITSTARFTHVWLFENNTWQLGKSLSYDHQVFDKPSSIPSK